MSNNEKIRIFYGCDSAQPLGSALFAESVTKRATAPVSFFPLAPNTLRNIYRKPVRREGASTDFAFTRFLVPFLCNYEGFALFCDGADMICTENIVKLWEKRDPSFAVQVVKQEHNPDNAHKFLGNPQEKHAMKNWSSVILFNCNMCRSLTPHYVEEATGKQLHQFEWLGEKRDRLIGDLPPEWNQLVDVHEGSPRDGIIHWTNGSPYFGDYRNARASNLWDGELHSLMGGEFRVSRVEKDQ